MSAGSFIHFHGAWSAGHTQPEDQTSNDNLGRNHLGKS